MKKAFTLAEVLVTLGIIGVVSAMTIPTLVKNHQRKVYVTQLQAVVSLLSQAVDKAIQDNNAISLDETRYSANREANASRFFNDYFKIAKNCGDSLTPCFADSYETLDGSDFTLEDPIVALTLANGVSISVFNTNGRTTVYEDDKGNEQKTTDMSYHGNYQLQIDINAQQGPNIVGRDLFYVTLYSDGKIAESYDADASVNAEKCTQNVDYGVGCFSKIVSDGWNMDY